MNDILINGFVNRIKAGLMTIEQVPIPFKDEVQAKLDD